MISTSRSFTVAVFFAALLPRLYVAIAWAREPVWDGHYYHIGARSIAAGLGYVGTSGGAWCHYPVGYSALLGFAYAIAGAGLYVGTVFNALTGAFLAALVYRLARYATSEWRARAAGLVCAFYPGLVIYAAALMTEPVAALALVAAALAAVARPGRSRVGRSGVVLAGVLLGLGTLVRPQSILCAPALAFCGRERGWRRFAVATGIALVVVAPWTIRNCIVMDGCAFVSTNGGWNLAIGSFPRATGRFAMLRGSDGCRVVTGQVQQDRCWFEHGVSWIADDPRRWLGLVPDKLGFTFDHESFPVGYVAEADRDRWSPERRTLGRGVLSWSHRALLALAVIGLLPKPSRKRPLSLLPLLFVFVMVWIGAMTESAVFWPVALAIPVIVALRFRHFMQEGGVVIFAAVSVLTLALTHAVFFGEDRYHLVVTPFLCVLAARAFGNERRALEV